MPSILYQYILTLLDVIIIYQHIVILQYHGTYDVSQFLPIAMYPRSIPLGYIWSCNEILHARKNLSEIQISQPSFSFFSAHPNMDFHEGMEKSNGFHCLWTLLNLSLLSYKIFYLFIFYGNFDRTHPMLVFLEEPI